MRKGFTLLEVLVAFVIFSIVMIALLDSAGFYYRISVENDLLNAASKIARENLESVRNMDYNFITASVLDNGTSSCREALTTGKNLEVVQLRNQNFAFGKYFNVVVDPTLDIKQVTVYVCWNYNGKFHQLDYSTVVREKE
ncbi:MULTISPECIES: type IV pilus modification PilV family protein [unclassified Desulfurobacterium]|uniref:type IV pilus modification PilV family protein n=1 Tax=Desulfurobacterium sp. TC5-1 TaxID=1158318 RepID=UPI0003B6B223|nr:type II secretion system protein [Desulfurobacterium sp. TC5-1]